MYRYILLLYTYETLADARDFVYVELVLRIDNLFSLNLVWIENRYTGTKQR